MKVLILGPIVNNILSGGVGVFDEGLYKGFKDLGDDVKLVSCAKSNKIDNIFLGKPSNKKISIYFSFGKIARLIKKEKPDLVISSVEYSVGIKKYKRASKQTTFVQVLHGVAWPINGKIKAYLVNKVAKLSRRYFDKVVTVSYLSHALNIQYNGIVCDKVIHNGSDLTPYLGRENRKYDFVYIGRLFKDKQIQLLKDAFVLAKEKKPDLKLAIAGFGELSYLFDDSKFKQSGIEFLGKINHNAVHELYRNTKCFISLHPTETFGTVFNEAILNGCNIVTQSTSGIAPLYFDSGYFHISDCTTAKELSERMIEIIEKEYKPVSAEYIKRMTDYLSYKRVAKEYKELIKQ